MSGHTPEHKVSLVSSSSNCESSASLIELHEHLDGLSGRVEMVVAAGPNRRQNAGMAMQVYTELGSHDVVLTFRLDPGEEAQSSSIGVTYVSQDIGTSYTEVAHSIEEIDADHLVFFAHNGPLQSRLSFAAGSTFEEGNPNVKTAFVFCHEGEDPTKSSLKEWLSLGLDASLNFVGGHDYVMKKSEGGRRFARFKTWLFTRPSSETVHQAL